MQEENERRGAGETVEEKVVAVEECEVAEEEEEVEEEEEEEDERSYFPGEIKVNREIGRAHV